MCWRVWTLNTQASGSTVTTNGRCRAVWLVRPRGRDRAVGRHDYVKSRVDRCGCHYGLPVDLKVKRKPSTFRA